MSHFWSPRSNKNTLNCKKSSRSWTKRRKEEILCCTLWSLKRWLTASGRGSLHWRRARYKTALLTRMVVLGKNTKYQSTRFWKILNEAIDVGFCYPSNVEHWSQHQIFSTKSMSCISRAFGFADPLHMEVRSQPCNSALSLAVKSQTKWQACDQQKNKIWLQSQQLCKWGHKKCENIVEQLFYNWLHQNLN